MYECLKIHMSHKFHVWVTNFIYGSRTIHDIQHQEGCTRGASTTQPHCCLWATHYIHEYRKICIYESRITCMSHEWCIWVTDYPRYTTPGRIYTRCFRHAAAGCCSVLQCVAVCCSVLFISHTLHVYTCMNAALYVWVTDYTYESRIMRTIQEPYIWVTNDA